MADFNGQFEDLLNDNVEEPIVVTSPDDDEPLLPKQASDDEPNPNPDPNPDPNPNPDPDPNPDEDDLITSYLKGRGLDPKKIQFENDEGGIDEVDFATLPKEEQLTMLQELSNSDFSDYEKNVINYIRRSGTDLQGIIKYFQDQAVQDFLKENPDKAPQKAYKIDDYTDDELYISDLAARFPNLTEDELNARLENAKINEELFNKEVADLRQTYKEEEDRQAEATKVAEQQQYEQLQNALLDAASRFEDIKLDLEDTDTAALGIEDEDRQMMLDYLLTQDKDGLSQFDKDLSNPAALIELA